MEQKEQKFQCTGDCLNCRSMSDRKVQWQYCAAQFTYNSMRMLQAMQETIDYMSESIEELRDKVSAIQDSEASVLIPSIEDDEEYEDTQIKETAQYGDGAEIDAPR